MPYPIHPNEQARFKALEECHILGTTRGEAYDDIALMASEICGTPIAAVTLIDRARQWFKSIVGLNATETGHAPL